MRRPHNSRRTDNARLHWIRPFLLIPVGENVAAFTVVQPAAHQCGATDRAEQALIYPRISPFVCDPSIGGPLRHQSRPDRLWIIRYFAKYGVKDRDIERTLVARPSAVPKRSSVPVTGSSYGCLTHDCTRRPRDRERPR